MRRPAAVTALLLVLQGAWGGYNARCNCERHRPSRRLSKHDKEQLAGDEVPFGNATPSVPRADLPANFDWADVAGTNYLVASWNQHIPTYCGSCYAHGTLNSVQDRIKVAKAAKAPEILLARQSFLNCGPSKGYGNGCGGGSPEDIFGFMHDVGLPDESCNNYVAVTTPTCDAESMCINCMVIDEQGTKQCWPVEKYTTYKVTDFGPVNGEAAMMAEVFERGPIVCGFVSDEAFDFGYRGGVWTAQSAAQNISDINHDVEVTGWGVTDDGVKFWQARNSWGTYWGESGFFKIQRGVDLNRFESECFFALVDATDEVPVTTGQLVGSMYGLVSKPPAAAQQSVAFAAAVGATDWSDATTPWPLGLASTNRHTNGTVPSGETPIIEIVMGAGRVGAAVGGAVAGAVLTIVMVMLVSRLQKRRSDYQNIDEFISPPTV